MYTYIHILSNRGEVRTEVFTMTGTENTLWKARGIFQREIETSIYRTARRTAAWGAGNSQCHVDSFEASPETPLHLRQYGTVEQSWTKPQQEQTPTILIL